MRTLPKEEFKKKEVEQLLKEQRDLCGKTLWKFLEHNEDYNDILTAVLNAPEPEFPAGKTYFGLGMGYEKGGATSDEMRDDIAWDIGISHQFIEGDKWKNDDMKTKAYKMAELELIKYGKGGKAKAASAGGGGIDWLITGK